MNPRYVAYAAAHGRTADEMLAHDREQYPGGRMAGFMIWIGQQWQAWHERHGGKGSHHDVVKGPEAHAHFDAWLASSVGAS